MNTDPLMLLKHLKTIEIVKKIGKFLKIGCTKNQELFVSLDVI